MTFNCSNCKNDTVLFNAVKAQGYDVVVSTCTSCGCCFHVDTAMVQTGIRLMMQGEVAPQPICAGHWGIEFDLTDKKQHAQAAACVMGHVLPQTMAPGMKWFKDKAAILRSIADAYAKSPEFMHIEALINVCDALALQAADLMRGLHKAEVLVEEGDGKPMHPDWPQVKASLAMVADMQAAMQKVHAAQEEEARQERVERLRQIETN